MGFLSSIATTVTNAAKENLRSGIINGFLEGTGQRNMTGKQGYEEYEYDASGHIKGISKQYVDQLSSTYGSSNTESDIFEGTTENMLNGQTNSRERMETSSIDKKIVKKYNEDDELLKYRGNELINVHKISKDKNFYTAQNIKDGGQINNSSLSDIFKLKLPDWGYQDFINERALWQKQVGNIFDEPGWFYFKIFFDFNTSHGLFGSLLNSAYLTSGVNTAAKYLNYLGDDYLQERPADRINALYKFASILSYINTNAPWYFKSVKGLDKLSNPVLTEFSKDRTISIEVMHDAIDMRLTTLMSLYKFACFDDYNHKEIIPENLRKFNMSIILFQTPLRYLHTSYTTNQSKEFLGFTYASKKGDIVKYKNLGGTSSPLIGNNNYRSNEDESIYSDIPSFKIYSLYNCEFDMESFAKIIPDVLTNETPYQLGGNEIIIKYDTCVEHQMNEFYEMMFGTNGFYFNNYSNFQINGDTKQTLIKYKQAHDAQLRRYKALQDTFGSNTQGGTILGILDSPRSYKKAVDATEAIMNNMFTENNNLLGSLGTNFALGLMGSSKSVYAPQGNIYGDYGIGSAYYKQKLKALKDGTNINTMRSYTYDPKNAIAYEQSKVSNYSALDWEKTKNIISNFDIKDWLTTGSKNLGSTIGDKLGLF